MGRNTDEIYQFVTNVIGKIPGVRKTITSIVPLIVKDVYQWRVPERVVRQIASRPRGRNSKARPEAA